MTCGQFDIKIASHETGCLSTTGLKKIDPVLSVAVMMQWKSSPCHKIGDGLMYDRHPGR